MSKPIPNNAKRNENFGTETFEDQITDDGNLLGDLEKQRQIHVLYGS